MPPRASPKSFPPVPLSIWSGGSENAEYLRLLIQNEEHNTYVPNGWGFTIYRAAFGPGSNERFATAMQRLDAWLRVAILRGRYSSLKFGDEYDGGLDPDPSAMVASRWWSEIVDEYQDKDKNCGGTENGDEDFTPAGRAFVRWGDDLGIELAPNNARYQTCLVVDDASLNSILDGLPEAVPEVKPLELLSQENGDIVRTLMRGAWVWALDRETMRAREARILRVPEDTRPPWIRTRLGYLPCLWFERLREHLPDWWDVFEEDDEKWDRVFWWNQEASIKNEIMKAARDEGVEE